MSIVAIIPARGGSKGIPNKNIQPIHGKPLVAYTIEQAIQTPDIDRVFVSTDSQAIRQVSVQYGAEVIKRPAEISDDNATSEAALLHAISKIDADLDLIVFLQATSPMRQENDIGNAIQVLREQQADSLFSASVIHGFVWRIWNDKVNSLSYDYRKRQRRQDAPIDVIENGSIYIFKPEILQKNNNRLGGKIAVYMMHPLDSFQIDEPGDLQTVEKLMTIRNGET